MQGKGVGKETESELPPYQRYGCSSCSDLDGLLFLLCLKRKSLNPSLKRFYVYRFCQTGPCVVEVFRGGPVGCAVGSVLWTLFNLGRIELSPSLDKVVGSDVSRSPPKELGASHCPTRPFLDPCHPGPGRPKHWTLLFLPAVFCGWGEQISRVGQRSFLLPTWQLLIDPCTPAPVAVDPSVLTPKCPLQPTLVLWNVDDLESPTNS